MHSENLEITVVNWDKYQSFSDRTRYPSWFKLHRDIGSAAGLSGLNAAQKWIWVILLAECCRKKSSKINVNTTWLANLAGVEKAFVFGAIEILVFNGTLTVNSRSTHGLLTDNSRVTHGQLNTEEIRGEERREEKRRSLDQNKFDLERLYGLFPRKVGKKSGMAKLKAIVRDQDSFDRMKLAIENYCKYCAHHKTETRYIKHFSTFVNSWEDWIDWKSDSEGIRKKTISEIVMGV